MLTVGVSVDLQPVCVFFRVIGLPDEEDWPPDSALSYLPSLGPGGPCSLPLLDLEPEERNLLTVSTTAHLIPVQAALCSEPAARNLQFLNTDAQN